MRQLVEQIRTKIDNFIEQRDALWLFIEATDGDAPIVLKLLADIEQANQTDLFLLFSSEFYSQDQYVTAVLAQLHEQHALVNQALSEQGSPPLPDLPAALNDNTRTPVDRLRQALCAARALLPEDGGHRLIWTLWPTQVHDPYNYVALIGQLVPAGSLPPWTRGVRIVLRELSAQPHAWVRRFSSLRSQRCRSDFSPPAIERNLEETIQNQALPEPERMQALMMQAALDHAQGRAEQAISKYNILLDYFHKTDNPTMLAAVMNHLGEVHHRQQRLGEARHWYECALVPAEKSPVPLLLLLLVRNLGDVSFLQERFADAAFCYQQSHIISSRLEDTLGMVIALQKLGLAQEKQGQHDAALESYEAAAALCQDSGVTGLESEHLEPLQRLYEQHGQRSKAHAVREQLEQLREVAT